MFYIDILVVKENSGALLESFRALGGHKAYRAVLGASFVHVRVTTEVVGKAIDDDVALRNDLRTLRNSLLNGTH